MMMMMMMMMIMMMMMMMMIIIMIINIIIRFSYISSLSSYSPELVDETCGSCCLCVFRTLEKVLNIGPYPDSPFKARFG